MEINPIKNKRDYRRTLKEIHGLMHAKRNSPDGDRLDVLVTLVEAWEAKHFHLICPIRSLRLSTTWSSEDLGGLTRQGEVRSEGGIAQAQLAEFAGMGLSAVVDFEKKGAQGL
jgi:hypothetical protein